MSKPTTIDEYIKAAPPSAQPLLRELRDTLKEAVPDAEECIKWSHPAFVLKQILSTLSAHKSYVSLAPTPAVVSYFKDRLGDFETTRCTIKFLYSEPLPKDLVKDIAAQRLCDVLERDARWM
jgi:uncharacterized protein YdhG (YjbR/CyaY superfamily)